MIKEAYNDRLKMEYFAKSFCKDEVKSLLEANGFSTATIERISGKKYLSRHAFAFTTELELKPMSFPVLLFN